MFNVIARKDKEPVKETILNKQEMDNFVPLKVACKIQSLIKDFKVICNGYLKLISCICYVIDV